MARNRQIKRGTSPHPWLSSPQALAPLPKGRGGGGASAGWRIGSVELAAYDSKASARWFDLPQDGLYEIGMG